MTVAGGCRRRDVTRGVPTPSSPRGGRQRERGGQPARLGEGSASLPAGMRERARRLGAASRSYRGRGRVWINSCVFAPRERPGRRRDGHAPSASWLLSWIWRCVTLLPAHPRSGRNAGEARRVGSHPFSLKGGGWGFRRSDFFSRMRMDVQSEHACCDRPCQQKNRVRLGASLGNLGWPGAARPSRSRASTPLRKARRSTTQRLEAWR